MHPRWLAGFRNHQQYVLPLIQKTPKNEVHNLSSPALRTYKWSCSAWGMGFVENRAKMSGISLGAGGWIENFWLHMFFFEFTDSMNLNIWFDIFVFLSTGYNTFTRFRPWNCWFLMSIQVFRKRRSKNKQKACSKDMSFWFQEKSVWNVWINHVDRPWWALLRPLLKLAKTVRSGFDTQGAEAWRYEAWSS